jgi:hypothetical protein
MGNGCSILSINKICIGEDISINNLEDNKNKNGNNSLTKDTKNSENNMLNDPNNYNANNNIIPQNNSPTDNNINNNNIFFKNKKLSSAQVNLMNLDKEKIEQIESIKKTKTGGFSNFLNDNISFNNFGNVDKNDIFEIHYISIKDNYNESMINYLNQIRNDPNSILEDIDNILKEENISQNKTIRVENEETHENIIFEDEGHSLNELKNYLNKVISIPDKFNLNDDLSIDVSDLEKNDGQNLNKKITKILVDKRKSIIKDYQNCQFFINFIKDEKISILYLLSENEDKSDFRNVVFDPKYTQFNVSWIKEKKKNFIAFLCFA